MFCIERSADVRYCSERHSDCETVRTHAPWYAMDGPPTRGHRTAAGLVRRAVLLVFSLCMVMHLTRTEHRSQPHQGHHRPDLAEIMREHTSYQVSAVAPSACIDPELSLSSACASLGVPRFLGSPTWPTITYGPRLTSSCCLPVPARSRPPHGAHRCTLLQRGPRVHVAHGRLRPGRTSGAAPPPPPGVA